jgi:hypothetical protein
MEQKLPCSNDNLNASFPISKLQNFEVYQSLKPYFKLHGSCNWRDNENEQLLVMGGGKQETIGSHPILKWYQEQFKKYLGKPNTRLMIIGYGFGDEHINLALIEATKKDNLKIFIINPSGIDSLRKKNIDIPNSALIGASR